MSRDRECHSISLPEVHVIGLICLSEAAASQAREKDFNSAIGVATRLVHANPNWDDRQQRRQLIVAHKMTSPHI